MSTVVPKGQAATVHIRPQKGMVGLNLRELWNFRELIYFLTWRDVLVRYKQTLLGGAWAILQPLLQMLVLNLLFGDVANLPTGGAPRPIFTFAALLPWNLFSNAVADASRSLVTNRNMITKVYFPRIIVPLSNVLSGVLDFAVAFLILIAMMVYYQVAPTSGLWALPIYIVLAMLTALGVGLWLAALNVHYRDVKYIIPFLTQFWLLATPIAYQAEQIFERMPDGWEWLFALNPLVGVVEGFRNALLGTPMYSENMLWVSVATSLVLLVSGLMYFRSMERTFADVVQMSALAIRVQGLGKQYRLGGQQAAYSTLGERLGAAVTWPLRLLKGELRDRAEKVWALRDVTFDVARGQVLGVVGRNGAGKSTMLKILSRVTDPTTGYAEINGRVGSLLEVGTGFHPELSGRENIFLNGAVLGMQRREIAKKFDEIVEFAGVDKFIDTAVKHYSSGMYLRLAFSVAAHLEPEILVVDEVLAVGDAEFQRKCLGKMSDVAAAGRTVLFVSHNMSAILRLTEETIVMEGGRLAYRAPTREAVDYYMSSSFQKSGERTWAADEVPADAAPFRPHSIRVREPGGNVVETAQSRQPLEIEFEYELEEAIQGLRVGFYLQSMRGEVILTSFDTDDPEQYEKYATREAGRYVSRAVLPANFLNEGQYLLGVNASSFRVRRYFGDERALAFTVDAMGAPGMQWPEPRQGFVRPQLDWTIIQVEKVRA